MGCNNSKSVQVHPEDTEITSFNGKTETPTPVLTQVDTNHLRQFIKTKHEAVALSTSTSHNFRNSSHNKELKDPTLLGKRYKFHDSTGSLEELNEAQVQIYLVTDRSISELHDHIEEKTVLERNPTVDEQEDMEIRKVGMLSGASSMAFQIPDNVVDGPITYKDAYTLIKKGQQSNTKSSDPNVKTLEKVWTSNNSICFAPLIFSAAGSIHTNQTNETDSVLMGEKEERPLRKSFTTYKMKNETLMENARAPYAHENVANVLDLKGRGDPGNYTSAPFPVEYFANKLTSSDQKQALQNESISDIKKRLMEAIFNEEPLGTNSKDSVSASKKSQAPSSEFNNSELVKENISDSNYKFEHDISPLPNQNLLVKGKREIISKDISDISSAYGTNQALEDSIPEYIVYSSSVSQELDYSEMGTHSGDKKTSIVSLIYLPETPKQPQNPKSLPILYGFQDPRIETKKDTSGSGNNAEPKTDAYIKPSRNEIPSAFPPTPVNRYKFLTVVDFGDYVVVKNAKYVAMTGNKETQKEYKWHSGYPGGLKTVKYDKFIEKHPTGPIRKAVWGMLPKNNLRKVLMNRLLIFPDEDHPHKANIFKCHDPADPLYEQTK
ncbi:54S ribosomal protein L23, mitochondrial [Boothiomyces sp. JEL0838]|nr:54S ribosomal protein L23, mitochondrial [Boothiomyces sp. JEL0838]